MARQREPHLSILFELYVVIQRVGAALEEAMGDSPLTPAEYALYSLIFDTGGATPTGIAERMGMPVTTVLDQLKEMEGRGHITRAPNPRDGRSYLVSLTPSGLAMHDEAGDYFDRAMIRISAHLEIEESQVRDSLTALGAATDATIEDLRESRFKTTGN